MPDQLHNTSARVVRRAAWAAGDTTSPDGLLAYRFGVSGSIDVEGYFVTSDYFPTLGIPLLKGRKYQAQGDFADYHQTA